MTQTEATAQRSTSVRWKLTRILLVTCVVTIVTAFMSLLVYEILQQENEAKAHLAMLAEVVGSNTTAALEFGDKTAAEEALRSLSAQPYIVGASIYTKGGVPFSIYTPASRPQPFVPPPAEPDVERIRLGKSIEVFRRIRLDGADVGTIYIQSNLGELEAHTLRLLRMMLATILISLLLASILSWRLQASFSGPLLELARTAFKISHDRDYSSRVVKQSDDEIGFLVDRFNEMMGRIQEREVALQQARDLLEFRVDERTRELQIEVGERKQAEQRLEEQKMFLNSVIDYNPVGIVVVDPQDIIRMCNPAFEKLFQFRRSESLGKNLVDLVIPDERRMERESARRRALNGEITHTSTTRRRKDGSLVDVETVSAALSVKGETPTGLLVLYWDITERKRAEEALLRAKEAAETASQAKSDFLANMSHEIRTPMNGIIGMTELALDTSLTIEQREYLMLVKTSADSLLTLINDILDFSKIEAGKFSIDVAEFSFMQGVGETLKALGYRAHQKGLELAWRVSPNVPDHLLGDMGRLRQIIVNLVGNALKFTERGEVVVEAENESQDTDGVLIHFQVRDTGIGIPKAKQALIFDAFTQADTSTTRKYGGTGLGLAITERLIKLMGGKIWLESEVGKGNRFHFTAHFGIASAMPAPEMPIDPQTIQDCPVLIVDDNQTNRIILLEMLTTWGMNPVAVENAITARHFLEGRHREQQDIRLLITDMQMPDVDGLAFAERTRATSAFSTLPIILLSSSVHSGEIARCRALGASAYLSKPVQPSELFDAIVDLLTSRVQNPKLVEPDSKPPTSREGALKVLLAEDNAVNRKLAKTILEKHGHTVVIAENGREALDALEREEVDAILMDVQMPLMDGLEAMRAIREKERSDGGHVHIIALTAHAMKGDRERCLEAGADEYLTKPIRSAELLSALDRSRKSDTSSRATTVAAPPANQDEVLDLGAALDRIEGDCELFDELVALYLEETPKNLTEIRDALHANDAKLIERLAHTVKGASVNIGANLTARAAQTLEQHARSIGTTDAESKIADLESEIERLRFTLESYIRNAAHESHHD